MPNVRTDYSPTTGPTCFGMLRERFVFDRLKPLKLFSSRISILIQDVIDVGWDRRTPLERHIPVLWFCRLIFFFDVCLAIYNRHWRSMIDVETPCLHRAIDRNRPRLDRITAISLHAALTERLECPPRRNNQLVERDFLALGLKPIVGQSECLFLIPPFLAGLLAAAWRSARIRACSSGSTCCTV